MKDEKNCNDRGCPVYQELVESRTTMESILKVSPKIYNYICMDENKIVRLFKKRPRKNLKSWHSEAHNTYEKGVVVTDLIEIFPDSWNSSLVKRVDC